MLMNMHTRPAPSTLLTSSSDFKSSEILSTLSFRKSPRALHSRPVFQIWNAAKRRPRPCKVVNGTSSEVDTEDLAAKIIEEEEKYLLQNYGARIPLVFTHGEGSTLYDANGRGYLDFAAGIAVNALGHSDAAWVEAVVEAAGKLCHVSNLYHTVPHVGLAKRLVEHSFAQRVFFCNSGTEANEGAIKFARRHARTKAEAAGQDPENAATELVSFTRCFHGRSMGALTLTANSKYKDPFKPLLPGTCRRHLHRLPPSGSPCFLGALSGMTVRGVSGMTASEWDKPHEFYESRDDAE
ncbi:hypothetical protein CYMTET_17582 [Cymbomonas tetramitiformis]|uniref:Acetylornithine transaminase n=1 Tax=Cymbomonas tetramitiformis TaxID=36881 RepID=A0AAE0GAF3_9CHLO|nr:hypothetical protein CYMTET_17582 [Cymbomonas tetramitiformis]